MRPLPAVSAGAGHLRWQESRTILGYLSLAQAVRLYDLIIHTLHLLTNCTAAQSALCGESSVLELLRGGSRGGMELLCLLFVLHCTTGTSGNFFKSSKQVKILSSFCLGRRHVLFLPLYPLHCCRRGGEVPEPFLPAAQGLTSAGDGEWWQQWRRRAFPFSMAALGRVGENYSPAMLLLLFPP